jgi:Fic family protein
VDPRPFKPGFPGTLVPAEIGGVAFIPEPLPPSSLSLPARTIARLADLREIVGELRGLTGSGLLADPEILHRPLLRQEALRTSTLEGTVATPEQVLLFELGGRPKPTPDQGLDEPWQEVFNYVRAATDATQPFLDNGLSKHLIRQMHQALLRGVRGDTKLPGQFRQTQVQIGTNARFVPPPAHFVEEHIDQLVTFANTPPTDIHGAITAFLAHYQFEAIHPFLDGNGRVGRLILSLMLTRPFSLDRPWLHLSEYFEQHKDRYVECLFNVSARGDWIAWIDLCLDACNTQASRTIPRCRALLSWKEEFLATVQTAKTPARLGKYADLLLQYPIIDPQQAKIHQPTSSLNTARADLDRLVDLGILRRLPATRPQAYISDDIMSIAYETPPD